MASAPLCPDGAVKGSTKRHEQVTVADAVRRRLNGESAGQMRHAEAIRAAGGVSLNPSDGCDTSRDQTWEYDQSRSGCCKDYYVLITTLLWLGIKIPLLAVPVFASCCPPMVVARLYVSTVPDGTERLHSSMAFWSAFWVAFILSLPAILFIILSLALDTLAYYAFSLLYCTLTCNWAVAWRSLQKIRPYSNGPSILLHLPDFFVCCMGQCTRQAFGETWYMVSLMWLLIPWLKYFVCCNPWVYELDHRLCQQISTEMTDLGSASQVADQCRNLISRARQPRSVAQRVDLWNFVPHYPDPPAQRRWALGLQAGGSRLPGKFTLIVHTTHAMSDASGSWEQMVLSRSCEEPIYRVMLWYSNPFHFLTGWVEASVSNGMPSQPGKRGGGEHPMWLVTGRTPQTAGRDSWTGSGMIDKFFDYWLPVFVHEMRRSTYSQRFQDDEDGEQRALQIANSKYQEVYSQDGISAPQTALGLTPSRIRRHKDRHLLSQFTLVRERDGVVYRLGNFMANLAETDIGKKVADVQQSSDVELAVRGHHF